MSTTVQNRRRTSVYIFALTVPGLTVRELTELVARMVNATDAPVSESWISSSAESAYVGVRLPSDDEAAVAYGRERFSTSVKVSTGMGVHRREVA